MYLKNYKTHKILGVLYTAVETRKKAPTLGNVNPTALPIIRLSEECCLDVNQVYIICTVLKNKGLIEETYTEENRNNLFKITDNGISIYLNKHYLHIFRERLLTIAVPILFSLIATIISLYNCASDNSNKRELEKVQQQMHSTQEQLNYLELKLEQHSQEK